MRAGPLDRRITIQRKSLTQSASGAPTSVWASIAHRRAAQRTSLSGSEKFANPQWAASEMVVFRIRWSQAVSDLSPVDRIIYPCPEDPDEQEPPEQSVYDIVAVQEEGRRDGLRITAQRYADVQAD